MSDVELVQPVQPLVKQKSKSDMVKISAKCGTCRRRLFTSKSAGTVCKNGHQVGELVSRTPKGTVVTKPKAARAH